MLKKIGPHVLSALCCGSLWSLPAHAAFDCLIEPAQMVEISSPVVGLLDKVTVHRGDRVSKGQVVAILESHAEQAATELAHAKSDAVGAIQTAERKIQFTKRKFERRHEMASEHLMPPQERDDAESEYELAKAELISAKESRHIASLEHRQQSSLLNLRTLRSPFNGVVVDQMIYPGEVVEPNGAKKGILKLAQLDPLRVHVILPIAMFGSIHLGTTVEVRPEAPINGRYNAKVKTLDKLIDAASGTFVAYLEMPNTQLHVPAGVKCKAEFSVVPRIIK